MKVLTKRSAALNRKPTLEIIKKRPARGKVFKSTALSKAALITKVLKKEPTASKLVQNGAPPKRRGRPPLKNKEDNDVPLPLPKQKPTAIPPKSDAEPEKKPEPKKRGRKPKVVVPEPIIISEATSTTKENNEETPKRRGRKRRDDTEKSKNDQPDAPPPPTKASKSVPVKNTTVPKPNAKEEKVVETNNNVSQSSPLICKLVDKNSRKYQCGVCDKNFLGSNDLRKHLRIHSDERPYSCPSCDKCFRQAGCLKNHIASQHGTDMVYTCDYCNKGFPIKERLRLHIRIHSGMCNGQALQLTPFIFRDFGGSPATCTSVAVLL